MALANGGGISSVCIRWRILSYIMFLERALSSSLCFPLNDLSNEGLACISYIQGPYWSSYYFYSGGATDMNTINNCIRIWYICFRWKNENLAPVPTISCFFCLEMRYTDLKKRCNFDFHACAGGSSLWELKHHFMIGCFSCCYAFLWWLCYQNPVVQYDNVPISFRR